MSIVIRPCRLEDAPALQEIERRAGRRFRDVGMDDVADHEPATVSVLGRYAIVGRSWAAVTEADEVVGYVLVDVIDGNAHIEQISVRPDHQGAGVGRALIERVQSWARDGGRKAITLTRLPRLPGTGPGMNISVFGCSLKATSGRNFGRGGRARRRTASTRPRGSACASTWNLRTGAAAAGERGG